MAARFRALSWVFSNDGPRWKSCGCHAHAQQLSSIRTALSWLRRDACVREGSVERGKPPPATHREESSDFSKEWRMVTQHRALFPNRTEAVLQGFLLTRRCFSSDSNAFFLAEHPHGRELVEGSGLCVSVPKAAAAMCPRARAKPALEQRNGDRLLRRLFLSGKDLSPRLLQAGASLVSRDRSCSSGGIGFAFSPPKKSKPAAPRGRSRVTRAKDSGDEVSSHPGCRR